MRLATRTLVFFGAMAALLALAHCVLAQPDLVEPAIEATAAAAADDDGDSNRRQLTPFFNNTDICVASVGEWHHDYVRLDPGVYTTLGNCRFACSHACSNSGPDCVLSWCAPYKLPRVRFDSEWWPSVGTGWPPNYKVWICLLRYCFN